MVKRYCRGSCGLLKPISEFGFNKAGDKRWSSCLECRKATIDNVKSLATERAIARQVSGEMKECLGIEVNRLCQGQFRSTGKFNRLCPVCSRSARDE